MGRMQKLTTIWKSKETTKKQRAIYRVLILSIATYGSESGKRDEQGQKVIIFWSYHPDAKHRYPKITLEGRIPAQWQTDKAMDIDNIKSSCQEIGIASA